MSRIYNYHDTNNQDMNSVPQNDTENTSDDDDDLDSKLLHSPRAPSFVDDFITEEIFALSPASSASINESENVYKQEISSLYLCQKPCTSV